VQSPVGKCLAQRPLAGRQGVPTAGQDLAASSEVIKHASRGTSVPRLASWLPNWDSNLD